MLGDSHRKGVGEPKRCMEQAGCITAPRQFSESIRFLYSLVS